MKIAARILSVLVLGALTVFYTSCSKDDPKGKSETDEQIEKLNGTWVVTDAKFEGGTPTLDHTNMKLTLSGTAGSKDITYTVENRPSGPSAWPSSGTFTFGTNAAQDLVRNDDVPVNYSVNGNTLQLEFTFNKTPYNARVENVSGRWAFTLTKQ